MSWDERSTDAYFSAARIHDVASPTSQSVSSAHTDRLVVRRISQTAAGRSSEDPGEGETWLASERAR